MVFAIIVLAVFSCLSVASAGLFDFLGGNEQVDNATYKFDGFSFDFAKDAQFVNNTINLTNANAKTYVATYQPNGEDSKVLLIETLSGEGFAKSVDDFKNYWISEGAKDAGTYKNWTIIDFQSLPKAALDSNSIDLNTTSYCMAMHSGSQIVVLESNNLTEMKKVADTFKEIK